jgi:hypothetical protein
MQTEKPEKGKHRYNDHNNDYRAQQSDSGCFVASK